MKKALKENGAFLGMSGETLQKYFLQLNEKENLLLSKLLQAPASPSGASKGAALLGSVAIPSASNGYTSGGAATAPAEGQAPDVTAPKPRDLPSGETQSFSSDNLASVCGHMAAYEASAAESGKALRALASLAYANAKEVADHPDVLTQVLRLLSFHPAEDNVQLYGMRALCNMAYEREVALGKLSSPECLSAFIGAIARKTKAGDQACEAVARVVAAELNVDGDAEGTPKPAVPPEKGPLRVLFTVVGSEDQASRDVVVQLVKQLVSNEVASSDLLVDRLIATAKSCQESGPAAAAWLLLAKQIAMAEIDQMSEFLITRGGITAATTTMQSQVSHAPAQLAGIEAMSGLVGTRWMGLHAFADLKGIERIEVAMTTHPTAALLQTKGIRALASGVAWPAEIQQKAAFVWRQCVKLTKTAMANLPESEELQIAGLEAVLKYLERTKKEALVDIKGDDCVDLVKAAMTRHSSAEKVQKHGAKILPLLGVDNWTPEKPSS